MGKSIKRAWLIFWGAEEGGARLPNFQGQGFLRGKERVDGFQVTFLPSHPHPQEDKNSSPVSVLSCGACQALASIPLPLLLVGGWWRGSLAPFTAV